MCVLVHSTSFGSNTSNFEKNSASYHHKCTHVFMQSTHYYCQILMKLEFSGQIFENMLKYQILSKSFQWEPSCSMRTDGRTETRYEADSRFSQF